MEQKLNKFFLFLIPIIVIGISYGYTVFPICLVLLILRLLVSDKYTVGFFLIMYGGIVGGVVRTMYPFIPVYGVLLNFLGIVLTFDRISELFSRGRRSIVYLFITFLIFVIFYLLGPQDEFAKDKLVQIFITGVMSLLGYYLFCRCEKINKESILQIIFMSTFMMIAFVVQHYHFSRGALFDYEWFRHQSYDYLASNNFETGTLVSYQHIAMNLLFGMSIFLSGIKIDIKKTALYVVVGTQVILSTGCRQAILGLLLVLIARFTYFKENTGEKKNFIQKHVLSIAVAFMLLIVSYQFLSSLNVDFIANTLESGDEGRVLLLAQGIELFTNNIAVGVGLGGYYNITGEAYPHNFIVETLSECGLIGMVLFIGLIISAFKKANISLQYVTQNNCFLFLLLLSLFVRVSVSGDFTTSIELFSAIYATLALSRTVRYKK